MIARLTIEKPSGLEMALLGCKINEENQFIDFRLITQRGKNHAFLPLCHQPHGQSFDCPFDLLKNKFND
ncbi:TPA: hypothetical protein ACS7ZY_002074 [Providencia alcalifaciens]